MQFFTLMAILFALIVAVFALQNAEPVEINFLFWQFRHISLVLVILGSAAFGALAVFLLGAMRQLRQAREIKELKSKLKKLQEASIYSEKEAAAGTEEAGRQGPDGLE